MANQYKNKVVYYGETLMDISEDTVTADKLLAGYTAHDASGAPIVGSYTPSGASVIVVEDETDEHGGTIKKITGVDISNDTVTADHLEQGYTAHDASGAPITGTLVPISGLPPKLGVIRTDAELVQTWTYDKMLVADEGCTIPSTYSTSNQVIKTSENIATYTGDPLTYRYYITLRYLTIPEYSIATLGKGREEYVFTVGAYEWVYNPAGQLQSLDGSKSYGQYSQMNALGPISKELYWSSATAVSVYTSSAYCLAQGLAAPSISSNKTITIKSPQVNIRGHVTYLSQTFYEAITDARVQYIIELWRAPIESGIINGWAYTSLTDKVLDNIKNNGGTLT